MIYYNYINSRVRVDYINILIGLQLSLNLDVALFSINLINIDILKRVSIRLNNKSNFYRRRVIKIYANLVEIKFKI